MNLSTELLVGIILIALGILLGAAAYMVLSSRKEETSEAEDESGEMDADEEFEPASFEEAVIDDEPAPGTEAGQPADAEIAEAFEVPAVKEIAELPSTADEEAVEDESQPEAVEITHFNEGDEHPAQTPDVPEDQKSKAFPKPEAGPRIQVATLLRDEVSGALIVQVGSREYRTADELRDSGDWTRVEFAASDLSKWIDRPVERPSVDRDAESGDRVKPTSMIEQINEILQEKIVTSGQSHLAVRLIEGLEGTAKVLIGVHSYELGEVPDESINNLIREAVADWEAGA